MNVLIIPEDFRNDQYILAPLFVGLFNLCGKPNAKIRVCQDPLLGGISEAMKPERLMEIFDRYDGMVDIYILCVDRDASPSRSDSLQRLERRFSTHDRKFFAVAAIEELEVWLLAGHDLPASWNWRDIRAERDPKEKFYLPYAREQKVEFSPGQGRRILGRNLRGEINRVMQRCSEELSPLLGKIQAVL